MTHPEFAKFGDWAKTAPWTSVRSLTRTVRHRGPMRARARCACNRDFKRREGVT